MKIVWPAKWLPRWLKEERSLFSETIISLKRELENEQESNVMAEMIIERMEKELSLIDTDAIYEILISNLIEENELEELNKHEAECICIAWMLKTKLYLIDETSHEWSDSGKKLINHELERLEQI